MNAISLGDSLTFGYGVTTPWRDMLSEAVGVTFTNGGVNGGMVADLADSVYAISPKPEDMFTLGLGTNDQRFYGEDATALGWFGSGLMDEAVWLSTPKKTLGINACATGSWGNTDAYGIGKVSHTQGDTIVYQEYGSAVYLGFIRQHNKHGTFSVTIDGVYRGEYSCGAYPYSTLNGRTYGPFALRFDVPMGLHYIVITVTSPTDGVNLVYSNWAAGNVQDSPRVVIANTPKMHPDGYAAHAPQGGSPANVVAHSNIQRNLVRQMRCDGFNAGLADWMGVVDEWLPDPDLLHPNQDVQAPMFQKVFERLMT